MMWVSYTRHDVEAAAAEEEEEDDDDEAPPDARELDLWLLESQVPGCTRATAAYAYDQAGGDVARALPLADDLTNHAQARAAALAAEADLAAPAAARPSVPPATLFRVSHTLLTATLSAGARPGGGTLQMRVPSTAESRRVTNEAPLLLFDKERRELHGVFAATGPIGDDGVLHFRSVKTPRPRTAPPHHAAPPHHVAYSSPRHPLIAPHPHPPGEAVPAAGRGGVRRPARVCRRRAAPHARTRRSQAALRGLQQAGAPCSTQHHVHMHMCMHMHMHTHVHVHMRVVTHACPPTNEQALLDRQAADAGQEAAASAAAPSAAGGAVAASTASTASGESVQAPR